MGACRGCILPKYRSIREKSPSPRYPCPLRLRPSLPAGQRPWPIIGRASTGLLRVNATPSPCSAYVPCLVVYLFAQLSAEEERRIAGESWFGVVCTLSRTRLSHPPLSRSLSLCVSIYTTGHVCARRRRDSNDPLPQGYKEKPRNACNRAAARRGRRPLMHCNDTLKRLSMPPPPPFAAVACIRRRQ